MIPIWASSINPPPAANPPPPPDPINPRVFNVKLDVNGNSCPSPKAANPYPPLSPFTAPEIAKMKH